MKNKIFKTALLVLLGLIIPTILFAIVAVNLANQSRLRLESDTDSLNVLLERDVAVYTNLIQVTQAFFNASDNVTRDDYRNFFGYLDLPKNYKDITAISFTKRVKDSEKQEYIESIKNDKILFPEGNEDFKFTPDIPKDEYYVITYIQPLTTTTSIGIDLTENLPRFEVVKKARDTGEVSSTGIVAGINNQSQNFFVLYAPLFKSSMPISTIEERREAIYGVLNFAFRPENLFPQVFGDPNLYKNLNIRVYSDDSNSESSLLWEANSDVKFRRNAVEITKNVKIADKIWIVKYKSNLGYGLSNFEFALPLIAIGLGGVVSLIFIAYVNSLINARKNAMKLVETKTAELSESERKLKTLVNGVNVILLYINSEGVFTIVEGKGLSALNIQSSDWVGKNALELHKDNSEITNDIKRALKGEEFRVTRELNKLKFDMSYSKVVEEGKVIGTLVVAVDITISANFQSLLLSNTEELERANKLMIDRELKMIELKKELAKYKQNLTDTKQ